MKSIVFTFGGQRSRHTSARCRYTCAGLFMKRYGAIILFVSVYAAGLLLGSMSARRADSDLLGGLNFLFTTNLSARMNQPAFSTFATSFASDCLFLLCVFLCGLSPWGMALTIFAPAFKGFGVGLSAGYLFITYGLKGVGFYLLVILAGTFIFSFALVMPTYASLRSSSMRALSSRLRADGKRFSSMPTMNTFGNSRPLALCSVIIVTAPPSSFIASRSDTSATFSR